MAQTAKNLPIMQETWVRTLDQEDPLEEEIAIHSSILAWRILRTEKPDRLHSMGLQTLRHYRATNTHTKVLARVQRNYNLFYIAVGM